MPGFYKKIIITSIIALCCFGLQGQTFKQFSNDKEQFIEELEGFIRKTSEEEADLIMAEFRALWPMDLVKPKQEEKIYKIANLVYQKRLKKLNASSTFVYGFESGKLNNYQIQMIIMMCNKMLKKRMKAIPDFKIYLYSVISFFTTFQSEDSFDAWNITVNKLIDDKKRYFTVFLTNCNNIFLYNSVYVTQNVKWQGTSPTFSFDYDSLPKVVFPRMDLYCVAKNDTARIYNTKGAFYPTTGKWKGKGGRVLWTRAGIPEEQSYAELSEYTIELKSSKYKADSVDYKNTKYFDYMLKGKLEEKLLANVDTNNATYPRFESYSGKVLIEEIEDSLDYEGGFMIKGKNFIGKIVDGKLAKITIKRHGKPFLIAKSQSFKIDDKRIATRYAAITMALDTDSIFHPALQLKFLTNKRELTLYCEGKGIGASPYYNTFHRMDMEIEWLKWQIDKDYMDFLTIPGSSSGIMRLESNSFFSNDKFMQMQGLQSVHPLYSIKKFVMDENFEERTFKDADLANYIRKDYQSVQRLCVRLAAKGFLIYNIEEGIVTVQDRLFEWMNAKSKKGDYDNIEIVSDIKGEANASMNLINYDITLRGVNGVALSRARKTGFIPENQTLKIHRNRAMSFGGIIRSERFEFWGKNFEFNYDDFGIGLNELDSVRLKAGMLDKSKWRTRADGKLQVPITMVRSVIEDISGKLEIDWPFNKSGILSDSFPQYPLFHSDKKSYVRYNKRNLRGKAYDPDKVYFQLDTFTVDSMGTFSDKALNFPGTFYSGGIFPDFREPLKLMPDHSLGFKRKTPPEGYPVYGGKATFYNEINLSNQGLMGDGDFEYITSTTKSNAFVFYLDSMNAPAQSSIIEPQKSGVEYPKVEGQKVNVAYYSSDDYFKMAKREIPMKMYDDKAFMHGVLRYDPKELTGKGRIEFENADLKSQIFEFQNMTFNADTSDFKLKADTLTSEGENGGIAFATNDVNAKIDFIKREGEFLANGGASFVDFPMNKYICFMDKFKWFMDKYELELSSSEKSKKTTDAGAQEGRDDLDLSGSEFISTLPSQDSLRFISPKANYDLRKYIIKAHEVKFINVADARVFTSDGEVEVRKNANMKPLEDAKIIANITTKYHTITKAKVKVIARRDYTAEGDYEYVDGKGKKQLIHFNNVRVDSAYQTVASGDIKEDDKFMLSDHFHFKGTSKIEATKKGMNFRGATYLQHDCKKLAKAWIGFESDIDPANVLIPVEEGIQAWLPGKAKGTKLGSGVLLKVDSTHLYSAFLSPQKYHSDNSLISAHGFLNYNEKEDEYQLSNKEKLRESNFPGNFVALNTQMCSVRGEGKIQLGNEKLGQVNFTNYGVVNHDPFTNGVKVDGALAVDFFLDEKMWTHMLDNMLGNPKLEPVDNTRLVYGKAIREMAGKELGDKLVSELNLYGAFKKVAKEVRHNIMFSDVKMEWDQTTQSFKSQGNKIGIGVIDKKQVNKFVNGHIELVRKKTRERLTIYIEIDEETWYFFDYNNGVMRVISSDAAFNAIITELKPDKREFKGPKEKGPYSFMLGTERSMRKFKSRMSK
ncbi:MAG: hypothetical protein CMP61_00195 [Flavobacteriales bacterium]|nr:hypothetical protein [Flavobacteriales bacterium]|tara:strand:- start:18503 stop:23152 length:4650 start_codon:yes stop_codon:yes gene_type:complete